MSLFLCFNLYADPISPTDIQRLIDRQSSITELVSTIVLDKLYDGALQPKINLGMNNVPVFDQGLYGTCATFAVTAAVDAKLDKGDYIDQLCLLQFGQYLELNGYQESGWEGAYSINVLQNLQQFGVINKHRNICGVYPLDDYNIPTNKLTIEKYHKYSEQINDKITYKVIETDNMAKAVYDVKYALLHRNRVVMGAALDGNPLNDNYGNNATYKVFNDTWSLNYNNMRSIVENFTNLSGHAMVIFGYDDEAVVIDNQGDKHKGVFYLRNSWGETAGDQGNFYMSYDYFKALAYHLIEIRGVEQ